MQSFTTKSDVNSRVFIDALYQTGEVPFTPSLPEFFSAIEGQFCQMIFLY